MAGSDQRLAFDTFQIDPVDQCLWRDGARVVLTPKAFAVLCELAASPGRLVTKEHLLATVWSDAHVGDAVLKTCIREIRRALGDSAQRPRFLETVHRRGYRLIAPLAAATPIDSSTPSPGERLLLAREGVLERLAERVAAVESMRRHVVFLAGETGIGKTAVVDAFLDRLPPGTPVARGHGTEQFGGSAAFLPVFEAIAQLIRGTCGEVARTALRRHAPRWAAELLGPGESAAEGPTAEGATAEGAAAPAASRERMLLELVTALEEVSQAAPLVLVLEDLHWSDPSTLDLLGLLARRRAPARILVVATYRPVDAIVAEHPVRDLVRELRSREFCEEMTLEPLGPRAVSSLLAARLGGATPPGLAALAHRRSGGNPLFVLSLLDDLVERDVLRRAGSAWQLDAALEDVAAGVPEGLRLMIERQIDRLSADEQRLLEAASAAGPIFSTAAVADALGRAPAEVEARCEELARSGRFLKTAGIDPGAAEVSGRYVFIHPLQQSVLYQRIAPARRVALHAAIGAWYERSAGSVAELTHHFVTAAEGGQVEKAIAYARRAGDRASALFAWDEAAHHYETALRLDSLRPESEPCDRAALLSVLGETWQRAGRYTRARELFAEAIAIARQAGTAELLARAVLGRSAAHQPIGTVDEELIALLRDASQALPAGDSPLRAMLLVRLAYALNAVPGTADERARLCGEAEAMARRLGDPDPLSWVLQYARWALWNPANLAERRAAVDELVALSHRSADRTRQITAHASRLIDALEAGDLAVVDEEIEVFARVADESRQPWFVWSVLRFRAMRALLDGRLGEAEELAHASLEIGHTLEHDDVLPLFGAQMAVLRWLQGRAAEVAPLIAPLVERAPAVPSWRAALAGLLVESGRPEEAREHLEVLSRADFADVPSDSLWLNCLTMAAETAAGLRDRRCAATLYRLLRPFAGQWVVISFGVACRGSTERYLGLLADTVDEWPLAERHFEAAALAHRQAGARPWLAATEADWARALARRASGPRQRERARALAESALAAAGEIGMSGLVRSLEEIA